MGKENHGNQASGADVPNSSNRMVCEQDPHGEVDGLLYQPSPPQAKFRASAGSTRSNPARRCALTEAA